MQTEQKDQMRCCGPEARSRGRRALSQLIAGTSLPRVLEELEKEQKARARMGRRTAAEEVGKLRAEETPGQVV